MANKPAFTVDDHDWPTREDTAFLTPLVDASDGVATSIHFGAFCLWPIQRLILQNGDPVRIGSRALEILIALLEHPGKLLSKKDLMARVWPDTFVEPGNLTVHISALRRALGDGRDGNRFLINIPGRGYCFVAPVTVWSERLDSQVLKTGVDEPSIYNG